MLLKYSLLLVTTLLIASFILPNGERTYGGEITLNEKTQISTILSNPGSFEGKRVLVEGTVNVCESKGCWIELSSGNESETIKVKVNDGEIVFPMEAKGKTALVEGEVYANTLEKESEETVSGFGKDGCSPSASASGCCAGKTRVSKVYQIKGMAAIIE